MLINFTNEKRKRKYTFENGITIYQPRKSLYLGIKYESDTKSISRQEKNNSF